MISLPKLFIGSSVEALPIANTVQELLQYDACSTVWTQNVFKPGFYPLESLLNILNDFSFAIFVFSADDIAIIRDKQYMVVRDNLIFEFGMFVGKIGKERTFFLIPSSDENTHLPSDLLGLMPIKVAYEAGDLTSTLSPACNAIRRQIVELSDIDTPKVFDREQYKLFLKMKRILIHDVEEYFAKNQGHPSLIAIDIDNFGGVNRVYGKKKADKVKEEIREVLNRYFANKFNESVDSYYVGDLGSDEFFIFFDESCADIHTIAREILNIIEKGEWKKVVPKHRITCSLGIAVQQESESIESLIIRALGATKVSKQKGGNCVSQAAYRRFSTYRDDIFLLTS